MHTCSNITVIKTDYLYHALLKRSECLNQRFIVRYLGIVIFIDMKLLRSEAF